MSLATLQRDFMAALRAPGGAGAIDIYRRQVRAGWCAALDATYPVVARLVGPAFFAEAADRYAERHPSSSGDLHEYGRHFAAFLAAYPHAASLAYLPGVARLEWALHEAAFAADAPPFDFARLATLDPATHESVVLRLHPAARLMEPAQPILAIWEANQPGRDGTPDADDGLALGVLVARTSGRPVPQALDADEWRCATAIAARASLGALADELGDAAPRLPAILARFADAGALGGFESW